MRKSNAKQQKVAHFKDFFTKRSVMHKYPVTLQIIFLHCQVPGENLFPQG